MAFLTRHVWAATSLCTVAACAVFAVLIFPRGVDFESRLAHAAERQRAYDLLTEGMKLHNEGKLDKARVIYDEALAIDDSMYQTHILLGVTEFTESNLDKAFAHFDRACSIWKYSADARNSRGAVRWLQGDRRGAMRDFDQALSINSDFKRARTNRGLARLAMDDRRGAREDFERVMEGEEKLLRVRLAVLGLGVLNALEGNLTSAEASFSLVADADVPAVHRAIALYNRARVYDALGEPDRAARDRDELKRVEQSAGDADPADSDV